MQSCLTRFFSTTSRTVPLSHFQGMHYGGTTLSFIRHRENLMREIRHQQTGVQENGPLRRQKTIRSQFATELEIEHHAWQCISFIREFSTLDFVVPNENDMMALIHVMARIIYNFADNSFLGIYRRLKFKMKIGYECWKKNCELSELLMKAIKQTIDETEALAIFQIQKHLDVSDGTPEYFSNTISSITNIYSDQEKELLQQYKR